MADKKGNCEFCNSEIKKGRVCPEGDGFSCKRNMSIIRNILRKLRLMSAPECVE